MVEHEDLLFARGEWSEVTASAPARKELLRAIGLAAKGRNEEALACSCAARDRARDAGDRLGGAVAARIAGLLKILAGREVVGSNEVDAADAELDSLGVPPSPRAQLP